MPPLFAPVVLVAVVVAKAAVATMNFIGGVGAAIASAASTLPASVTGPIAKAATAVAEATPPGVKDFVSQTANKVVETQKKLQEFVDKNTPQKGTPEGTALDDASKAKDVADKVQKVADNVSDLVDRYEESHKSGDSITPSSETQDPATKSTSDTPQRDIAVSREPALGTNANIPATTPDLTANVPAPAQTTPNESPKVKPH